VRRAAGDRRRWTGEPSQQSGVRRPAGSDRRSAVPRTRARPQQQGARPVPGPVGPGSNSARDAPLRARPALPAKSLRPRRRRPVVGRADPVRRLYIGLLCIIFVLSLFAGRLVQLQGIQSGTYRKLAQSEQLQTRTLHAVRGTITGADSQILAMTVQTYTVFADPKEMTSAQEYDNAVALEKPLGIPEATLYDLITHPTSPRYVILSKGVSTQTYNAISALNLPGINAAQTYSRSYPDAAAANVVGLTNTSAGNLNGISGIEDSYNSLLAGRAGSEQIQGSTNGVPIPLAQNRDTPVVNGSGLRLTIVPDLQWQAEQACEQRVYQTKADNCTVVIMQPHTGRILALAQWPPYNPALPESSTNAPDIALQNIFDPGSTLKVITAAAAIEHGGQTPMSTYNIPYQISEGGGVFHDAEWTPGERYTIAGIIAHSSNVGMVQVARHVAPQIQDDYLKGFGLGQYSGLTLPGESPGILPALPAWWADERYTLAFGQGVSVTALQMASVYATIANGGVRVSPNIVAGTTDSAGHYTPEATPQGKRVINAQTARDLLSILQQVPAVDEAGAQPWGIIPGYAVAAKTGTSQEWSTQQKCLCEYGSSYIGMAPGDNPQLVVAVNVQNPRKGGYYGAVVAGPVFYQVMKDALHTMQIAPDGAQVPYVRLTAP
jgi:cell division protein FtsI (penicillin-binding protein 3)